MCAATHLDLPSATCSPTTLTQRPSQNNPQVLIASQHSHAHTTQIIIFVHSQPAMQSMQLQQQQALSGHTRPSKCSHVHPEHHRPSRRQLVIRNGEARSANRTKWTQNDAQARQQQPSAPGKDQYVAKISQLTQADHAHDLVSGVRLAAVT